MTYELLSASQVGRRLGVSAERVRQLARSGRLPPAQTTPLGQLWSVDAVDDFAATRDQWGRYSVPSSPGQTSTMGVAGSLSESPGTTR
jgi:hypothetical protein